jgi:hypothetical protein
METVPPRYSRWRRLLPDWVDRLAQVGVVRSDSDEESVRKATLTLTSSLITVLAVIWVGTYGRSGYGYPR